MAATDVDQLNRLLAQIVGEDNVLTGANAARFSGDALGTARGSTQFAPAPAADVVVVRPGDTPEVAAVVGIANRLGIGIVPHGGGSGLMGGALALTRSVVIDTTRMDRVLDVSRDDQTALVQSGAVLRDLNSQLKPHGLVLGHDPWTVNVATVGGTISTDSLGYLGAKYGSMGDQVLGLTVVLPDGSLLETGAVAKASVGPDLRRLFIAAEGCFGVITEALLRVFPVPEERSLLAFQFASFGHGLAAILAMRSCGLVPDILEFNEEFGANDESEPAPLYLGFEGFHESVRAATERARSTCVASGGRELPESEVHGYWEHRHDIGDRFAEWRRAGQSQRWPPAGSGFDYAHVTLRVSRVLEYRERCLEMLRAHRVQPAEVGVWCHPELFSVYASHHDGPEGAGRLAAAVDEMLRLAQEMGGSMEYCHGVGVRLAHLMPRERGASLDVLRSIKGALDPKGIMNPGKLGL